MHGAHARHLATRGLEQDIEVSLEDNHALEVHLILETVIVSHYHECVNIYSLISYQNNDFQLRGYGQLGTIGEHAQAPAIQIQESASCSIVETCHVLERTLKQGLVTVSMSWHARHLKL